MISWECVWERAKESFFISRRKSATMSKEGKLFNIFILLYTHVKWRCVIWPKCIGRIYIYRGRVKLILKSGRSNTFSALSWCRAYMCMMMSAMRMKRKSQWSLREKKKYKKSLFSYNRIKRANEQKQWFSS